jgi:hypothetical protein
MTQHCRRNDIIRIYEKKRSYTRIGLNQLRGLVQFDWKLCFAISGNADTLAACATTFVVVRVIDTLMSVCYHGSGVCPFGWATTTGDNTKTEFDTASRRKLVANRENTRRIAGIIVVNNGVGSCLIVFPSRKTRRRGLPNKCGEA